MCLTPIRVPNSREPVGCGGCWQCRSAKEYDWVGRCIAEAKYSDHARFLTLTYAGDTPFAAVFYKKHIQDMLGLLRRHGFKVRYLVTGEYGEAKGRVHWHAILFFVGSAPDMEMTQFGRGHMFDWKYWPHGKVVAKMPDPKAYRYVVKYMFKDKTAGPASYITPSAMMSKKPPLGHAFVMELAADLVEQGLPMNAPEYSFLGVIQSKSKGHRKFWLQGKTRENFLQRYCELWRTKYGTEPPSTDYLMERYLDPIARAEMAADTSRLARDLEAKRPRISARKLRDETFAADGHDPFGADRRQKAILMIRRGDDVGTVELFTDDTATVQIGDDPESLLSHGSGSYSELVAQVQAAGLHPRNVRKVSRWLAGKWSITVPADCAARPASRPASHLSPDRRASAALGAGRPASVLLSG